MCDALGTIIVDHLSKGELSGIPVQMVNLFQVTFLQLTSCGIVFQEEGEPHELQELRHEKE